MSTKNGERLDAGTLRWVADQLARHDGPVDPKHGVENFRRIASEADAQPPRLSDWVKACEGTALGEPAWVVWEDGMRGYYRDGAIVCVDIGDGQCLGATITSEAESYSTPAALRAALDKLGGGA